MGEYLYHWYKEKGICPQCRKENAANGRTLCLNCADKASAAMYRYRDNMSEERRKDFTQKNIEHCRMRYSNAKANGICVRCFKQKARVGKATCEKCASLRKIKYREGRI